MPSFGEGHGVGAALDQAAAEFDAAGDGERREAVQELLFDDDLGEGVTGALDQPSPLSAMFAPKGRGRPKGATNRVTRDLASWLLSQHRHPVAVAMECYSMTPVQLAERLGLSKMRVEVKDGDTREIIQLDEYDNDTLLELFKLQLRMAEHASKYVAQAMPQAVQVQAGGDFTLAVTMGGPNGVSLPARAPVSGDLEGQAVQALGVVLAVKSDG